EHLFIYWQHGGGQGGGALTRARAVRTIGARHPAPAKPAIPASGAPSHMPPVFLNYDQEALDRQYTVTNEALRPARDKRELRVVAECDEVRRTRPRLLDFVYGIHPRERVDLYPTAVDFAPLVIFIHGGYWKGRSKDQFAWLAPAFTD